MTPITALGSRYGIQGALGRSVKRASTAFVPTDITGCKLWLDFSDADYLFTDAGTTKVSTDGDAIYQVNDKSGNGYHAVQLTAGYRPLYKLNMQNGLSIGYFDGSDDHMSLTMTKYLNYSGTGASAQHSFYIVYKLREQTVGSSLRVITKRLANTGGYTAYRLNDTGYNAYLVERDGGSTVVTGTSISLNTAAIQIFGYDGTDLHAIVNNGLDTTASVSEILSDTTKLLTIAKSDSGVTCYKINMCELISYDTWLSSANHSSVLTYLNNKWAIYS